MRRTFAVRQYKPRRGKETRPLEASAHGLCNRTVEIRGKGEEPMHDFENYDDRFSCPSCQEPLLPSEFSQTCDACGFLVEVFLTRDEAVEAMLAIDEDTDSIIATPCHVFGLGWITAHTRLLLV